jgi:hypothetical protein
LLTTKSKKRKSENKSVLDRINSREKKLEEFDKKLKTMKTNDTYYEAVDYSDLSEVDNE